MPANARPAVSPSNGCWGDPADVSKVDESAVLTLRGTIPDPIFITETIEAAAFALQWGTLRWLQLGGHDPSLLGAAVLEVSAKMPKKDG